MDILIILGLFVGFLAGFFGIGGGTIMIPALLMMGYSMHEAVAISIVQMLFSSVWGSYLNIRKKLLDFKMIVPLGFGALLGGLLSPLLSLNSSERSLELIFLFFVVLGLIKFFYTPQIPISKPQQTKSVLFLIGSVIAFFSASVGIGGAILMTPLLYGFLGYELKKAIVISLFFIACNAVAASFSWSLSGALPYKDALLVGVFSLIGVGLGLKWAKSVSTKSLKVWLIVLYVWVLAYFIQRLFV